METLRKEIDRLRVEVAELRASRERLVLAADAERNRIERDLHAAVQQRLVSLAVSLQLAVDAEPAAQQTLLEEMRRDVQQALDETAALAERICPPYLESGGLAVALRAAAVRADVPAAVDVVAGSTYPPHLARTVYWCWLEVLKQSIPDRRSRITVRAEEGALTFEVVADVLDATLEGLRERIDALRGRITIESIGSGTHVHVALPLPR